MPLIKEINFPDANLYIWHIEEPDDYFIEAMVWDQKQLEWISKIHPAKKREYLASRFLIYKITGKLDSHLYKDEFGKLHLKDTNQNISISHSGDWTGLVVSDYVVGFDLQVYAEKIHKIAKRFLNPEEYICIEKYNNGIYFLISWNLKEAVYKANGKKGINFAEQINFNLNNCMNDQFEIRTVELKATNEYKNFTTYHGSMENFGWALALEK